MVIIIIVIQKLIKSCFSTGHRAIGVFKDPVCVTVLAVYKQVPPSYPAKYPNIQNKNRKTFAGEYREHYVIHFFALGTMH